MKLWTLCALALTLPSFAQAATETRDWKAELEAYKAKIADKSNAKLIALDAGNSALALGTCSASVALTAASFIAETLPVVNGLSEIAANSLDAEYETVTYQRLLSWEAFMQFARGTAGGGLVAVKDALKFVMLWLEGQENRGFEGVKKMYASSFTNAEALFASQGKCMMSLSKVVILRAELERRGVYAPGQNQ